MPFTLANFYEKSPYLVHLTYKENLPRIRDEKCLESTEQLLAKAGPHAPREAIRNSVTLILIDHSQVLITDQEPLLKARLPEGSWSPGELAHQLNRRVFFWRTQTGGRRVASDTKHFRKYQDKGRSLVYLRIPSRDMIEGNQNPPEFCQYNSGSPTSRHPQPSPRDENTFVTQDKATFAFGDITEVTFLDFAILPDSTCFSEDNFEGPWVPLS
jgi:hypothetical protein